MKVAFARNRIHYARRTGDADCAQRALALLHTFNEGVLLNGRLVFSGEEILSAPRIQRSILESLDRDALEYGLGIIRDAVHAMPQEAAALNALGEPL